MGVEVTAVAAVVVVVVGCIAAVFGDFVGAAGKASLSGKPPARVGCGGGSGAAVLITWTATPALHHWTDVVPSLNLTHPWPVAWPLRNSPFNLQRPFFHSMAPFPFGKSFNHLPV